MYEKLMGKGLPPTSKAILCKQLTTVRDETLEFLGRKTHVSGLGI